MELINLHPHTEEALQERADMDFASFLERSGNNDMIDESSSDEDTAGERLPVHDEDTGSVMDIADECSTSSSEDEESVEIRRAH